MTSRVIVTGSLGFIGRAMVPYLRENGYDVLGIDIVRPLVSDAPGFRHCNILDRTSLISIFREFKPSVVVHLAARTDLDEKSNLDGYAANIAGTKNVIDAVEAPGTVERALFTSSQLVCELGYVPQSDTDYRPRTLYGESKVLTEKIVRERSPSDVSWCLLRPTTIWGEGMSLHYQRFLRMLTYGSYFHVGHKELFKSYGYIGNCVFQYLRFIQAPALSVHGRTFYVADYQPLSLRTWIDALSIELSGRKVRTLPESLARVLSRAGDTVNAVGFKRFPFNSFRLNNILTEYRFDLRPTEQVCGPLPYSMMDGVKKTAAWFKNEMEVQKLRPNRSKLEL